MTLLFSNSRVSFSRPGSMMQIPSMAFEKKSPNLFTIDLGGEVVNFSSDFRRYSGAFAIKFQTRSGYNIGLSATSLASPAAMKEAGFHVQKTIFKYGDVVISSGIHDLLYMRDGNDVIRINDISFFTVFTNHNKFDNYDLSIHFGGGTGKLGYDPQITDSVTETTIGGFLGFKLKTPYFQKNGGFDLLMEYDGEGINIGAKLPITNGYTINFGMTHFENLSEFATESKIGADRKDLQADAPAVSLGFTFEVPNLFNDENSGKVDAPFDVPNNDNISTALGDSEDEDLGSLIVSLRDSIVVAYHENKNLYNENLLLQQKMAVLMDSTRVFHLERQVDYANNNIIMRHISRALRYFYAEEYREALTEIDKAIEVNPNIALAYARRGSIYYRLGDFQRATMNWNIALKLDPEFTEIQDLLRASKDNRLSSSEMKN
ncbi:MAG: hypothetical protein H8E72_07875 [Candidatus Marinimicrobia bacterium]|nr:hypothetical protein [Candidatus Neomarinimicrobiota bacterium]